MYHRPSVLLGFRSGAMVANEVLTGAYGHATGIWYVLPPKKMLLGQFLNFICGMEVGGRD